MSNRAFEDAINTRTAITADKFRGWWSQEVRETARYLSCPGQTVVQLSASVRMIMGLAGMDKLIVYRPASESEALTTVYEKDHIEKTVPGLEAVYLTSRPVRMCDGAQAALWVIEIRQKKNAAIIRPQGQVSEAHATV